MLVYLPAVLEFLGSVPRLRTERAALVRYSPDGTFVACCAAGKGLEVFRIRTPEEAVKKVQRRKRRQKEKRKGAAAGGGACAS